MSSNTTDHVVAEYLRELESRLGGLPVLQRRELLADVEAHIANERVERSLATEAEVLEMLERLGSPEVVAAAAYEEAEMSGGQPLVSAGRQSPGHHPVSAAASAGVVPPAYAPTSPAIAPVVPPPPDPPVFSPPQSTGFNGGFAAADGRPGSPGHPPFGRPGPGAGAGREFGAGPEFRQAGPDFRGPGPTAGDWPLPPPVSPSRNDSRGTGIRVAVIAVAIALAGIILLMCGGALFMVRSSGATVDSDTTGVEQVTPDPVPPEREPTDSPVTPPTAPVAPTKTS
jgi:hypothetical protein